MEYIHKRPPSLQKQIHNTNRDELLKIKRPLKSFKKSFKPTYSLQTQLRRSNTNILTKDLVGVKEAAIQSGYRTLQYVLETVYHANSVANISKNKPNVKRIAMEKHVTKSVNVTKPDTSDDLPKRPVNWTNTKKSKF